MIEHLKPYRTAPAALVVLFDFDGTLSLIRSGWMDIMLQMIMETVGPLHPDQAAQHEIAEEYVARLTGQDTWFQMEAFAQHVKRLGGTPKTADEYKTEFLNRLQAVRQSRLHELETGARSRESLLVPGTFRILDQLQDRGLELYISSGTDHKAVVLEAELLGLTPYFGANILGAGEGGSTKAGLLKRLVDRGTSPERIVFFGDGAVEIAATRAIGGVAVGMATDEPECRQVHPKKRIWLIQAGADFIAPNYLDADLLTQVMHA